MDEHSVELSRSEVLAVSRLLWDIGSDDATSHQHRVDCYHWGAVLDSAAGMPAHPTDERTRGELVAFYEAILSQLEARVASLREGGA